MNICNVLPVVIPTYITVGILARQQITNMFTYGRTVIMQDLSDN
jgi:hypothetical protein